MSPICKSGFKNLDFLIPSGGAIGKIPKTIIFMNKMDNTVAMANIYAQGFLSALGEKNN